jgi:hypothetical protein
MYLGGGKMLTKNRLMALFLAMTGLVLLTPIASAADQTRLTGAGAFIDSTSCNDRLRVDWSYDEVMHTYYDADGNAVRLAFTGPVTITYTNLTNGQSYTPNSSGPGTLDLLTGQIVLRGGNAALFDANGVLIATDGRVVLDASGNIISIRGHITDVCAHLGSSPK